jgi:hypothetical protein
MLLRYLFKISFAISSQSPFETSINKFEKEKMKKLANKFSKQKYRENFKNLMESLS